MFTNGFFLHEFVGLGPYKIDHWNAEETVVYKPFDDFFLGRPKIGTIVMQQLESSEASLTRLLAGTVQMAAPYGLTFEDGTKHAGVFEMEIAPLARRGRALRHISAVLKVVT